MLEFLNSIRVKDLDEFGEFINSPYFNKSKSIIRLFNYLKTVYPSISSEHTSAKKISLNVFSQRKTGADNIRKLLSEFMKLYERFVIQKANEVNKTRNKVIVLNYFRLNKLEKRFRKGLTELNKEMNEHIPVDFQDYETLLRFRTEMISYYYNVSNESYVKSIQDYSKTGDVFYVYVKLCVYNSILNVLDENRKSFVKNDKAYPLVQSIFESNQKFFYSNHPEIVINYYDLMMRMNFDEKYLYQLISYYNLKKKILDNRLRFVCILPIEGYLRTKLTFENSEFSMSEAKILHNMHNELYVKTNLFKNNVIEISEGYFPHDMFIYAIINALNLGKKEWCLDFIEKNAGSVLPQLKESIYNYCTALILFFEKRNEEALNHLIRVSHKKIYIYARILQLKIYFEREDYRLAEYQLAALKKFVQRSKEVSARRKRKTELFIRYYNLLLKLVTGGNKNIKSDIDELKYKLNNHEEYFYNRIWMNEVLERLRNERVGNK